MSSHENRVAAHRKPVLFAIVRLAEGEHRPRRLNTQSAAGFLIVSHRSRLRLLRFRCAPEGGCAALKRQRQGTADNEREVRGMWDYLMRQWRVGRAVDLLLECVEPG